MRSQKALACTLAILLIGGAARGITEGTDNNPFQRIVDRNVFGLRPPPPPPVTEPPKAPTPKITLTGIITMLGKKRALMKTPPPPVKPGEPPQGEQYYTVGVGEQDREIEVLEIDEKAGKVKVKYSGGEPISLNFVDNGAKPIAAAPAPGLPGTIPGHIPQLPNPAARPMIPGTKPLPTRTLRLPTPITSPGAVPGATGYTPSPGAYVSPVRSGIQVNAGAQNVTLPSFRLGTPSTAQNQQAAQQEAPPSLSPEQQMVLMEVQREQNRNNPNFPPMPPTALGQEIQQAARP